MTTLYTPPRVGTGTSERDERRRRASLRRRALLATLVAGVLAWSLISFLSDTGETAASVTLIPGTGPGGIIGEITTLTSTVTAPKGNAQLQEGVSFARIDVANAFHRNVSVHLGWVGPKNFSVQTQTANWQIRMGLYYPARTGACTGSDPAHAVTLAIDSVDHCLYRDTTATGSGVSTTDTPALNHVGTQMLAIERISAVLRPQYDQAAAVACTATADADGCLPAGTDADARVYFVVGSLLNPGGTVPPGKQASIDALRMHIQVTES